MTTVQITKSLCIELSTSRVPFSSHDLIHRPVIITNGHRLVVRKHLLS